MLFRNIYLKSLRDYRIAILGWGIGMGLLVYVVLVAVPSALATPQARASIVSLGPSFAWLADPISLGTPGGYVTWKSGLTLLIIALLPLLLMAFAATQANRWAADEEDGRLELVLSTPQPRLRVLLGRFAALTTATIIIGVLTLAATAVASVATGLNLDWGNLAAATLSIIPLGLLVAAIGYLLSGWLSTAIDTGLVSFLLVIWFFISYIGPELHWLDATLRLSAFYYYGTPLLHGLPIVDMLGVLALVVVLLVIASARFVYKDIGR